MTAFTYADVRKVNDAKAALAESAARLAQGENEMVRFALIASVAIRREQIKREDVMNTYPGAGSTGRVVSFLASLLSQLDEKHVSAIVETTRAMSGADKAWWQRLYSAAQITKKDKAPAPAKAIVAAHAAKAVKKSTPKAAAAPAKAEPIEPIAAARAAGDSIAPHIVERAALDKACDAFRAALIAAFEKKAATPRKPRTKR